MISSEFEMHRLLQQQGRHEPISTGADGQARTIDSGSLFAGHAEVRIEHHGAVYRLKRTALGKLILTK